MWDALLIIEASRLKGNHSEASQTPHSNRMLAACRFLAKRSRMAARAKLRKAVLLYAWEDEADVWGPSAEHK